MWSGRGVPELLISDFYKIKRFGRLDALIFSMQVPESAVRGADLLSKPLEFFAGIHAQTLPLDPTLRHCEAVVAAPASSGGFPKCAEASSSKNRQSAPRAFNQAPSQSGQIQISRPEPGGREGDLAKCGSSKKKRLLTGEAAGMSVSLLGASYFSG